MFYSMLWLFWTYLYFSHFLVKSKLFTAKLRRFLLYFHDFFMQFSIISIFSREIRTIRTEAILRTNLILKIEVSVLSHHTFFLGTGVRCRIRFCTRSRLPNTWWKYWSYSLFAFERRSQKSGSKVKRFSSVFSVFFFPDFSIFVFLLCCTFTEGMC